MTTEALLISATSRQKFKKHNEMQTKSCNSLDSQSKNLKILVAL